MEQHLPEMKLNDINVAVFNPFKARISVSLSEPDLHI